MSSKCITKFSIELQDGLISYAKLTGKCPGNLKHLSDEFIGLSLDQASCLVDFICGDVSCKHELKTLLRNLDE